MHGHKIKIGKIQPPPAAWLIGAMDTQAMDSSNKTLLVLESIVIVPATSVLSVIAAVQGAKMAGIYGGSWGWGFMLAVPLGFILGLLLSGAALAILKRKNRSSFLPILYSAGIVGVIVFAVSFVVHGLLKHVF